MVKYLSDKALANLKLYKYSAVDNSLLSHYIFNHVWNYAITLVPLSIAPNALTLFGLLFTVVAWVVCYIDLFEGYRQTSLAFVFYALCVWMYTTLDAVDGKQARRTGTSSPLGQLFDHGSDSINLVLVFFVMRVVYGFELSYTFYVLGALSFVVFCVGTWEEYCTGTLHLGIVSGPVEGAIILITSSLLSAIYGVKFWDERRHLIIWGSLLMAASSILGSFWHVHKIGKISKVVYLLPFLLFLTIMLSWPLLLPSVTAYTYKLLYHFNGAIFVNVASSIILAHLTKAPFPVMIPLYFVQVGVFVWSLWESKRYDVDAVLSYGLIVVILWHALIVLKVINEICAYLGIACLTIPKVHASKQL